MLVIDSLTWLSKAAYAWFDKLNPTVRTSAKSSIRRRDAIMDFLQNVTAENMHCHVMVLTHIQYNETETKGFASSIGKGAGPEDT